MMTLKKGYAGLLDKAYAFRYVVTAAVSILILTSAIATRVGVELAPQLSGGDFALQLMRAPSTGIEVMGQERWQEKQLLRSFP